MLALLAGGALVSRAGGVTRASDDALAKELTEALPGCGVWRWNLARGHVHWSAPMYRLLGLEPRDEVDGLPAPSPRRCIPTTISRAEIDRHLREGPPTSTAASGCAMPTGTG